MADIHEQFDRPQTAFLGLVTALVGLGLLVLARHLGALPAGLAWLGFFPVSEIGGILFSFGLLGIGIDYVQRKQADELRSAQLRRVITEEAPALRDAVIRGFAFDAEDLGRVATPAMLDQIIRNSLALRLGDATFAQELYEDIRDQAIAAAERWLDARVEVTLSPLSAGRGTPSGSSPVAAATGAGLLEASVRWEYQTVPASPVRRFVCVSDRQEYRELSQEAGATSAWYIPPVDGLDGGAKEAFELLEFTVDGRARPIRRSAKSGSQTYSVAVGKEALSAGRPVTVSYTYRTVARRDGRLIKLDVEQPTRGLSVELAYGGCDIADVRLLDFLTTSTRARVSQTPAAVSAKVLRADFDGWVLPRAGVVFVWEPEGSHAAHR
ncbi:hypothetical protein [Pseudofrankia sp. BMG5.36]|uniref:hypothetical protein n=1 Tax=Pseudofrankia sp. BMG5.36 TaxID=1834512 RepID=UPI0008D9F917|nr:hypothetical protein [Pseudofrankia sp. BMG5.36]OHV61409.1 hypothetical protein BCD48_39785 [Pseudofrankia sp. BMG5.36]